MILLPTLLADSLCPPLNSKKKVILRPAPPPPPRTRVHTLSPSCLLPTPQERADVGLKEVKVNICCFPVESCDS